MSKTLQMMNSNDTWTDAQMRHGQFKLDDLESSRIQLERTWLSNCTMSKVWCGVVWEKRGA